MTALFEQVSVAEIPASFRFRLELHGGPVPQLGTLQKLEGVARMSFVPAEVI